MFERLQKMAGVPPMPAAPLLPVGVRAHPGERETTRPKASSTVPPPGRLHKPTPQEASRLANFVYTAGGQPLPQDGALPEGWQVSSLAIPGVVFRPNPEGKKHLAGFNSALYERPNADGTTTYAYVTAGTNDLRDGLQDILQPLGLPAQQYHLSVNNAMKINDLLAGQELYFIGHSLGGGLASANALATGRGAMTFNAAGLSKGTRKRENLPQYAAYAAQGGHIDAYVVAGEVVSRAQSTSPQLVLLALLKPLLQRDMPRLLASARRHGLRAEGEIHELAIARPLSGRDALGRKNRFYPSALRPTAEQAELLRSRDGLQLLLATGPAELLGPVRALLDVVNFFLGTKQSLGNHSMTVVEELIQKYPSSLPDR